MKDFNLYWIWLSLALGPACPIISDLMEVYDDPYEIYCDRKQIPQKYRRYFLPARENRFWKFTLDKANEILTQSEFLGLHIITPDSEYYPQNLLQIKDFPIVLYAMGNIALLQNDFLLGVVGTRDITLQGGDMTLSVCKPLAEVGVVIVSGFNVGGDEFAHKAAMNANKGSIAVLAYGLDTSHRHEMRTMGWTMMKNGSVFITEFPVGMKYSNSVYPIRNRIISGMSRGLLVTQAPQKSGTLITANAALKQGRDVFSIPYDANNIKARGSNDLIKQGAIPVTEAQDVLLNLWPQLEFTQTQKSEEPITVWKQMDAHAPSLSNNVYKLPVRKHSDGLMVAQEPLVAIISPDTDEGKIIAALRNGERSIDELVQITSIPVHDVMSQLSMLEITGEVEALPGKRYQLK